MKLNDLFSLENPNEEQRRFIEHFYEWTPLICGDSAMNLLCKHIEETDFSIKKKLKSSGNFDFKIYKNHSVQYTPQQKTIVLDCLTEYKKIKAKEKILKNYISFDSEEKNVFKAITTTFSDIVFQKINNADIITNILVDYLYFENAGQDKDILWKFFGSNIIANIRSNKNQTLISFPFKDEDGDIEYLGNKYKRRYFEIETGDEN